MQEMTTTRLRRGARWLIGAGLLIWWGWAGLIPAALRAARLESFSGPQPAYAFVSWAFGPGVRPISVIFDLTLDNQTAGSITTDGEASEAEIVLIGPIAPGAYTIQAAATYRILGMVHTRNYCFAGTAPDA